MPMSKFRYQRREPPSRNKAILGVGWWFHRCENVNLINLRRKPFLCATSEVAQGRCDWPVSGGEHWNFYENKHLCYMIYFPHSFWMTLYCPSKYFTFAWCDWQTSSLRLPNQRRARDVITPERKEIQLSLWVLMWKMRAGLERDNRESCFCTKRATFACTIGQSLQQLGFYSTWFPRDKGGFS